MSMPQPKTAHSPRRQEGRRNLTPRTFYSEMGAGKRSLSPQNQIQQQQSRPQARARKNRIVRRANLRRRRAPLQARKDDAAPYAQKDGAAARRERKKIRSRTHDCTVHKDRESRLSPKERRDREARAYAERVEEQRRDAEKADKASKREQALQALRAKEKDRREKEDKDQAEKEKLKEEKVAKEIAEKARLSAGEGREEDRHEGQADPPRAGKGADGGECSPNKEKARKAERTRMEKERTEKVQQEKDKDRAENARLEEERAEKSEREKAQRETAQRENETDRNLGNERATKAMIADVAPKKADKEKMDKEHAQDRDSGDSWYARQKDQARDPERTSQDNTHRSDTVRSSRAGPPDARSTVARPHSRSLREKVDQGRGPQVVTGLGCDLVIGGTESGTETGSEIVTGEDGTWIGIDDGRAQLVDANDRRPLQEAAIARSTIARASPASASPTLTSASTNGRAPSAAAARYNRPTSDNGVGVSEQTPAAPPKRKTQLKDYFFKPRDLAGSASTALTELPTINPPPAIPVYEKTSLSDG
ncbi:hypothetical protein BDK51DRAFT_40707 [Blyttiomyces helicus]|uniref:Uncharacterized protein n=1 Tax=Blyttiomyces helicus TaxID=388810 RepID=A0A4P9W6K1_9FUNG|nr:hypothetical protein BDK51DRAFT_40707 [Blyttiomyces helicus]|eukprot:RKO87622.1 hypothetical protein BDK51DRAFT_40707 [Blyttiomyces helicus]